MDLAEFLKTGFDYDLWANRRWLRLLEQFKDLDRVSRIFEHILLAQRIWLERCGMVIESLGEDEHLGAVLERQVRAWQALLSEVPPETQISYVNLSGQSFTSSFGEIALHVINHGTFHRGHLRGIADKEGLDKFEDTDLIMFFREHAH